MKVQPLMCRHPDTSILLSSERNKILFNVPFVPKLMINSQMTIYLPRGILSDALSTVDVVLITQESGILGLPFLLRTWAGKVYATEAALEFGRELAQQWLDAVEDRPDCRVCLSDQDTTKLDKTIYKSFYTRQELKDALDGIHTLHFKETRFVSEDLAVMPLCSGYSPGSCNWILRLEGIKLLVFANSAVMNDRICDNMSLDIPTIDACVHMGSQSTHDYKHEVAKMCKNSIHALKTGSNIVLCVPPTFIMFDVLKKISQVYQKLGFQAKSRAVIYANLARFFRRLPLLHEWISETDSWLETFNVITPGIAGEMPALFPHEKPRNVMFVVSSVDVLNQSQHLNVLKLLSKNRLFKYSFIADCPSRLNDLKSSLSEILEHTTIETFPMDPCLNETMFSDLKQSDLFPSTIINVENESDVVEFEVVGRITSGIELKNTKSIVENSRIKVEYEYPEDPYHPGKSRLIAKAPNCDGEKIVTLIQQYAQKNGIKSINGNNNIIIIEGLCEINSTGEILEINCTSVESLTLVHHLILKETFANVDTSAKAVNA